MATRVNTGVVIGIVAGLVVLLGGVTVGVLLLQKSSGASNVARGDAAFAEGDYARAESQYSRAVNKQQTNVEYINKWGEALVRIIPETEAKYNERYGSYLGGVLEKLALQRPSDGAMQRRYIDEYARRVRLLGANSVNIAEQVATEVTDRVAGLREDDPDRKHLLRWRGYALADKAALAALTDEEYQTAVDDLENAYEVVEDPADRGEIVIDLYRLHRGVERQAAVERQEARRESAEAAWRAALQRLESDHADHPGAIVTLFLAQRTDLDRTLSREERNEILQAAYDDTIDAIEASDMTPYDGEQINRYVGTLVQFATEINLERLEAIVRAEIERVGDSSKLYMLHATIQARMQNHDEAHDLYQTVVDLPNVAVSLEGLVLFSDRRESKNLQALQKTRRARFAVGEEREQLIAEARELRNELEKMIPTGQENRLKLLDMQIAMLDGEFKDALELLNDLDAAGQGDQPAVLMGYVEALVSDNQPGSAKQKLEQYRQATGGGETPQTMWLSANIEQMVGNLGAALGYYNALLELLPDNEGVQNRISVLNAQLGQDVDSADPVIQAVSRARELRSENDLEGAVAELERARAADPENDTLIRLLVSLDLTMDNRDRAIERIREALEAKPDSRSLQTLLTRVEIQDPVEAQLAIVEGADETELAKTLARESVYRRAGMIQEAQAEVARAMAIDETDPGVISTAFVSAARRGRAGLEEAARIVDLAVLHDADNRGGELYKGRLEILRQNSEEAIRILGALTERNAFDSEAWRWLGGAQRAAGRIDDSVESYGKAYGARPSDVGYAADYANALVAAGRGTEAARVLSPEEGVLQFGEASDQLVEMWLRFEGQYGNRDRVRSMRAVSYQRDAGNLTNTMSYLQLLYQDEEFEIAQEVIDKYASLEDANPLRIAQMQSALLASQEKPEEAVRVIEDYIEETPEDELTINPFRMLALMHEQGGRIDEAAAVYERGRAYQSDRLELDRSLADLRFRQAAALRAQSARLPEEDERQAGLKEQYRAGYTRALDLYENLMERAGFGELIVKRIAEAQLRLGRYEDFERTLASMIEETGDADDLQVLLMQAVAAQERGNTAQMFEYIDRAVEKNSNNPEAYYRRAQMSIAFPERLPDAVRDLEEATRLNPGYVDAWSLLARTHAVLGEPEKAFQKLRSAIESNPNNDQLPRVLVALLEQTGRLEEAMTEAISYARADETDDFWTRRAAGLSQRSGNFDEAYRWLTIVDEANPSPEMAADRLNALLRRSSGVDIPDVNRLMRRIETLELEGDADVLKTLLMARGEAARGNIRSSDQLFIEAHNAARPSGPSGLRFFTEALLLRFQRDNLPDVAQNEFLSFINDTEGLRPLHPYLKMELIQPNVFAATTEEERRQINAALEAVSTEIEADDQISLFRYYRLSSNLLYGLKDYRGSVEAAVQALNIAPNSADIANNLAYTLSADLGRHEEALEFAERAAQLTPNASYVLDTLGVIYTQLGRTDDAINALNKAVQFAGNSPDNRAVANMHKVTALLQADREREARQSLEAATRDMRLASPQTRELYQEDLDALIQQLR